MGKCKGNGGAGGFVGSVGSGPFTVNVGGNSQKP